MGIPRRDTACLGHDGTWKKERRDGKLAGGREDRGRGTGKKTTQSFEFSYRDTQQTISLTRSKGLRLLSPLEK